MAKAPKKSALKKVTPQAPVPPVTHVAPASPLLLWMAAAGLALACVMIYFQVGTHGFINYDDPNYVLRNPHVNRGLTAEGIRWAFTTFDFYYWQPLTWISHMIDCQMFGLNAGPQHLVSVALHAINAALLCIGLWMLTGSIWRSALAAGLFALHPLRVESVAWIAERKDVLSGMFWMLTLIAYARYVRATSAGRYAAMMVAFLCAVMSKPSVVTLPFVLLLLDWWPLRRLGTPAEFWPRLREKLPMLGIVAASSIWTFIGQHKMGATVSLNALPFYFRVWNALQSYVRYIGKFLWPANLGVLYPYGKISAGEMTGCLVLLLFLTVLVIWRGRRSAYLATGWFWFIGAMVPMIGLAQTGVQALADRFTYLPMIGLTIITAWGLGELCVRFTIPLPVRFGGGGFLLGVLTFASFIQTTFWKDSFTLFDHTIAVTEGNDIMHLNLADLYQQAGQFEKAAPHFEAALQIEPNNVEARNLLGGAYLRARDFAKAEQHLQTVLKLKPDHVEARKQLAECYLQTGRRDAGKAELMRVLQLSPNDFEARAKLMTMQ